jgi:hypothetical protein
MICRFKLAQTLTWLPVNTQDEGGKQAHLRVDVQLVASEAAPVFSLLPLPQVPVQLKLAYEDHALVDEQKIFSVLQPPEMDRKTNAAGQLEFQVRIEQVSVKHYKYALYCNLRELSRLY